MLEKQLMVANNYFNFIGVSTEKSAINKLFPLWCEVLNVSCRLNNINLPLNANPENYANVLNEMKNPNCIGGLVTSHKSNIFKYGSNIFREKSQTSILLEEISAIYKLDNLEDLYAEAMDAFSIIPVMNKVTKKNDKWLNGDKQIIVFGGGGAGLALVYALHKNEIPYNKITLIENDKSRFYFLNNLRNKEHINFSDKICILNEFIEDYSDFGHNPLLVNATGMGKDLPGTPLKNIELISDNATFWDFNYRGDLDFLSNALDLQHDKSFYIEDGWEYFIHGWLFVMCKVFKIEPTEYLYKQFDYIAQQYR